MSQTVSSAIAWWARMRGDQPAVVLAGEVLSYRTLQDWSDRVAAMLVGAGVEPGDRVAICSTNSLAYVALIFGTIRAGAIASPINFRYKPREIAELLETTEPRLVFAGPDQVAAVREAGVSPRDMSMVEGLREGDRATAAYDPEPDWPVVIIATSGSTAKPKGVVFTNRTMTAYAANWSIEEPSAPAGSKVITMAPLNTSAGFVQLVHYTIAGCTLYMEPQFDPARALDLIQRERITCFAAVPAFFEFIAARPEFANADLSSLKLVTAGGARVSRQLLETYRAKGIVIRQIYGQTEVGGNATIMPAHLAIDMPEKCGWGGAFIDIRVVRPDGSDCAPGEQGEILMRSPGMMIGYWRNPEETARALRDGWLWSGDIGVLDENGLLTFVDRLKDLIISGGLNISAAEVERVVCEFPGIREALAIAAPDPKFGETPLVVYHGDAEVDVAALIAHCDANLSNYKVPRYVAFSADPLPRLATGKLSKPAVRELYADAHLRLPKVR
ncbi:class I adenylate-forming enzyme family protein [Novosphingobium taihuense]|uniref:Fatty-acyl-CoA synthase n=1 Tax=Novosphingobium taihuense TaxID=260085 RepID=A0A7W7A9S5_9SPHN|nr:AMP-binding protein [Novosphingobium taihuense]MBB4613029.1 fatty-acyl-CoA synthase [Novosphingobium taihuense]TWH85173.1 fatty-acyl-CoA synthase [Novosphingobium taihuense]